VLERRAPDPEEIVAALDRVTGDDVARVAQDLIAGRGANLAVIGPFDDAERFERLLA
jgi:predicted Zn-dependent peptidase